MRNIDSISGLSASGGAERFIHLLMSFVQHTFSDFIKLAHCQWGSKPDSKPHKLITEEEFPDKQTQTD